VERIVTPRANPDGDRQALLGRLAARIARIEGRAAAEQPVGGIAVPVASGGRAVPIPFGSGLPVDVLAPALHEVRAPTALDAACAAGFALALAGLAGGNGAGFWIAGPQAREEAGALHGPGLGQLGFAPGLVRVHPRDWREALWAAGEIAAAPGAGFCLIELRGHPRGDGLAFSRRLALRAAASAVPVVLLRQGGQALASAAATRWSVTPAPSAVAHAGAHSGPARKWLGPPAWAVTLEKARGGRTGSWIVEWNSDERTLVMLDRRDGRDGRDDPREGVAPPLPGAGVAVSSDRPAGAAALGNGLARRRAS